MLSNNFLAAEGLLNNIYLLFSEAQISTDSQLLFDNELNITSHKLDISMDKINQLNLQLDNISQRAIDNISSIGGIQGALSRSFLRFSIRSNTKKLA